MSKNVVYRIENNWGEGIYRACETATIYSFDSHHEINSSQGGKHPTPNRDSKLVESVPKCAQLFVDGEPWAISSPWLEDFKFAFSTIEQFRAWFYSDRVLREAHREGYKLVKYRGRVYHGNAQAIIFAYTMKKVEEISLLSLLS